MTTYDATKTDITFYDDATETSIAYAGVDTDTIDVGDAYEDGNGVPCCDVTFTNPDNDSEVVVTLKLADDDESESWVRMVAHVVA